MRGRWCRSAHWRRATPSWIPYGTDSATAMGGRGAQTFDQRTTIHAMTALEAALLDLLGQHLGLPVADLLGEGRQRDSVEVLGYLFYVGDRRKTNLPLPAGARRHRRLVATETRRSADTGGNRAIGRGNAHAIRFQRLQTQGRRAPGRRGNRGSHRPRPTFPEARITLDPNGAWSLAEAIRLCKGQEPRARLC